MTTYYKQAPDCETVEIDGEWMILHSVHFTITKLNETGGFCWSLLKDAHTVDELVLTYQTQFNNNKQKTKNELQCFLKELEHYGLIEHAV
ncbi:PqqD family protein [Bacillus sp. F19]|nr:PqqD family protein [Bacillus sp. F19]